MQTAKSVGSFSRVFGRAARHGEVRALVLDRSGHVELTWDMNRLDEVTEARQTFERWRREGKTVRRISDTDEADGQIMTTFDPAAEGMVAIKANVGG